MLIKYTGKYVKIYFILKITCCLVEPGLIHPENLVKDCQVFYILSEREGASHSEFISRNDPTIFGYNLFNILLVSGHLCFIFSLTFSSGLLSFYSVLLCRLLWSHVHTLVFGRVSEKHHACH